jgi:hypothetical protein
VRWDRGQRAKSTGVTGASWAHRHEARRGTSGRAGSWVEGAVPVGFGLTATWNLKLNLPSRASSRHNHRAPRYTYPVAYFENL